MIKGINSFSAAVVYGEIRNTFWGERFKPLRSIFHLDPSKQNIAMKAIPTDLFESAIKGLNPDERALANAYFLCINSQDEHQVEVISRKEALSQVGFFVLRKLKLPPNPNGKDVDEKAGGGANNRWQNGTHTVIVRESKRDIDDYVFTFGPMNHDEILILRNSTPAELLAHETLGHGYGSMIHSPNYRHEDAVQMSNLYWRVRGYHRFYRDGSSHFQHVVLSREQANLIPNHFKK